MLCTKVYRAVKMHTNALFYKLNKLRVFFENMKKMMQISWSHADLSLDKHLNNVCAAGFFRLHQLHRVRRSHDSVSAATLVHAFVSSRVDYCNTVFAGVPKTITDRLQRVLNAAARIVSDTRKFDRSLS